MELNHILNLKLTENEKTNLRIATRTLRVIRDFMEHYDGEYLENENDNNINIKYSEIEKMADTLFLLTENDNYWNCIF